MVDHGKPRISLEPWLTTVLSGYDYPWSTLILHEFHRFNTWNGADGIQEINGITGNPTTNQEIEEIPEILKNPRKSKESPAYSGNLETQEIVNPFSSM